MNGVSHDNVLDSLNSYFMEKIDTIYSTLSSSSSFVRSPPEIVLTDATSLKSSFGPISQSKLLQIVSKLPNKQCNYDIIPTSLFKVCFPSFGDALVSIINHSFEFGYFPMCLRRALVTPTLKRNCDNDIRNYRPISSLALLSKIMEKVVVEELIVHIEATLPHYSRSRQSAYKTNHSTETALMRIKDDIAGALDLNQCVYFVQLDLSAAFDTIDHSILLHRLEHSIGISGAALSWLKSYLTHRTQAVFHNGALSQSLHVKHGVPQGSVLGPLLFNIYIDPVYAIIDRHGLSYHAYADDTVVYTAVTPGVDDMTKRQELEKCLMEVAQWLAHNKLRFNADKTDFIVFSNKPPQQYSINVCGAKIVSSPYVKCLGVQLDSQLNMAKYVSSVCQSGYAFLKNMGRIKTALDIKSRCTLYHSFVISRIDYCNGLLNGVAKYLLIKLQRLQNAAARIVTGSSRHCDAHQLLINLHWLPVQHRITYKILYFVFRCFIHQAPGYLIDLLKTTSHGRCLRSTTSNSNYIPSRCHRRIGMCRFSVAGPNLWNALTNDVKSSISIASFKAQLKTYLFKHHLNS